MSWLITLCAFLWTAVEQPPLEDIHDIHLSKCRVKYSEKTKSIQITLHMFLDDLEKALEEKGGEQLYLFSDREDTNSNAYILEYLDETFRFKVDGRAVNYDFIGKEISEDLLAVWCYFEIYEMQDASEVSILYSIFQDVYDDQMNIMTFAGKQGKESYFTFSEFGKEEQMKL